MTSHAISVDSLTRSYGKNPALKGVSFDVDYGEIFGLIGPDGGGKTTIFRILTTLILPDSGKASVCGYDVVKDYYKIRSIVGYMPGRFSLYQDLSVEENLNFFSTLFGSSVDENYYLIKDIFSQLEPFKKRKAAALSGGMKQKLALSCALIHKPRVLFLDEPTTGVDPVSRKEFWGMLKRLKADGLSILVSTPYMDEATICDRIALIREGRFMDTDTPENVMGKFDRTLLSVTGERMHALLSALKNCPEVESAFAFGDRHHIVISGDSSDGIALLSKYLSGQGFSDFRIVKDKPSVEDCFMLLDARDKKGMLNGNG
jgi:ABC-2 type transport system ATP-binding protein